MKWVLAGLTGVTIALGALPQTSAAQSLSDSISASQYLRWTEKERAQHVSEIVLERLSDAPEEQERVATVIGACLQRVLIGTSARERVEAQRRQRQDLALILDICFEEATGNEDFATKMLAMAGAPDDLRGYIADNVASMQIGVQRCGAHYTRRGRVIVDATLKVMPLQVENAVRNTIDDVRSTLLVAGKRRTGRFGETVALCKMIAEVYGKDELIVFPAGSKWRR